MIPMTNLRAKNIPLDKYLPKNTVFHIPVFHPTTRISGAGADPSSFAAGPPWKGTEHLPLVLPSYSVLLAQSAGSCTCPTESLHHQHSLLYVQQRNPEFYSSEGTRGPMGVLRSRESLEAEMEEFREMRLRSSGILEFGAWKTGSGAVRRWTDGEEGEGYGRMVCVTSAVSFLGLAIVNRLLALGYSVRLALESQEDLEKLRDMGMFGEMGRDGVWAVMANVMDVDSLCHAFDGCAGVFHTSAFVDPGGVSGYSKHMAHMEATVAERVIESCVRTPSVRKCVFTSSLLACVWRQNSPRNRSLPAAVDENCWSDENLCRDKKLWFALGKTMAEKAAWRAAHGRDLKLVTVCPALVTGPQFCRQNSTGSIAYLKGAHEMFAEGLLATVDVKKVAEAHVCVYEAMSSTACGRYVCYDHVIRRAEEAAELERQLRIANRISGETPTDHPTWFKLCNRKISRLMSSRRRCTYDLYSILYN